MNDAVNVGVPVVIIMLTDMPVCITEASFASEDQGTSSAGY